MKKYCQTFLIENSQKFQEEFNMNLLRFEKEQPNIDYEQIKAEIAHKNEV